MPTVRGRRLRGINVLDFSSSHEAGKCVLSQCNIAIRQKDRGASQRELESQLCLLDKLESVSSPLCISISPYLPQMAVVRNK